MAKIKILHLIATNFVGGPEKQILNHALSVDRDRFEVILGSYSEGKPENPLLKEAQAKNLPIFQIDSKSSFNPGQIFQLRRFMKAQGIELLCTHGYKSNLIGFWAARGTKIPQIAFVRGWTGEDWKVKIYDWLDRLWIRWADRIVCVSEAKMRELLKLKVPADKITVIYNAFPLQNLRVEVNFDLRKKFNLPADSKIIASFGRLSPEKGQRYLVLAAEELIKRGLNLKILIFGDGKEKNALQNLIDELKIGRDVILPGFVENPLDYMRQADLIVNPSLTEGLPNVILEALALKRLVVATSVGGTPEIIEDGRTGFLVPPHNPEALADKIQFALENRAKAGHLAEAGYKLVQTKFSLQSQTEKLQNLYLQALS